MKVPWQVTLSSLGADSPIVRFSSQVRAFNAALSSLGTDNPIVRFSSQVRAFNAALSSLGTDNPVAHLSSQVSAFNAALSRLGNDQLLRAAISQMTATGSKLAATGAIYEFAPSVVAGGIVADAIVSTARAEGALSSIRGTSFGVDALAEDCLSTSQALRASEQDTAAAEWLDEIFALFQRHLVTARSLVEVLNQYQTFILIILTAIMTWSELQSPTSDDIARQTAAIQQGNVLARDRLDIERERLELDRQRLANEHGRLDLEKRNANTLEKLADTIGKAQTITAQRAGELPPVTWYLVNRPTSVHEQPSMKSSQLADLSPGDLVGLTNRAGKWVLVEYVDPLTGLTQHGWVLKKYMRRVD